MRVCLLSKESEMQKMIKHNSEMKVRKTHDKTQCKLHKVNKKIKQTIQKTFQNFDTQQQFNDDVKEIDNSTTNQTFISQQD